MNGPLPIIEDEGGSWYREGVNFSCTGCGKCCSGGPGAVWVAKDEIKKIAEYLNLSVEDFRQKYVHRLFGRDSLKDAPSGKECIFLKGKFCTIYEVRPVQCQTYPWWPGIMRSPELWQDEAKWCEGIGGGDAVVPAEKINRELERYQRDVEKAAE